MRTVGAALEALVLELRADGFSADTDPERLNLNPGALWVKPFEIRDRLKDSATLVVWVYSIVSGQETDHAITLLDDSLERLLELYDLADSDDVIDLSAAVVIGNSAPLPAYRLAIDLNL